MSRNLSGWFDSPIEEFKLRYSDVQQRWNSALVALDQERVTFYANENFARSDPELMPAFETLEGKLNFMQSTISGVQSAFSSVVDFFSGIGNVLGIGNNSLSGLGVIPAIPWATVALITTGIAGVWALARELRSFNVDVTNKQIALANIARAEQGLDPLPYVNEISSGGGFFEGVNETAKYLVIGALIVFVLPKLLDNRK